MAGMIKNWNTKKLKTHILDQLERNAEVTGYFLQRSARARLYAIQDPQWGQGYRRRILANLIVHEIERKNNGIVLTLGVLASPMLAGYKSLNDSRHFGFYIEMGSRRYAAQPYLRPTVFGNPKKITDMMTEGIGK